MKKIQHECLSPLILENFILLYHAETGIATSVAAASAAFSRTSGSEATGRVVLGDKTGLLVSHLLCCLHNIPLEYVIPHSVTHHAARVSARCVLRLQMI